MEQQSSYVLKLSLTEIALRRVVVGLCSETDILPSVLDCRTEGRTSDRQRRNAWREAVQEKMKTKVSGLLLPEELKTKIMYIVKPISVEILTWKIFHERFLCDPMEKINLPILEKLCWTSTGTIEYEKTAEALIRNEMFHIVSRYKLACLYCLEDHIRILWEELPENTQKEFYKKVNASRQPAFQYCWPYILKGEVSKLNDIPGVRNGNFSTFHHYAFEYSAFTGNKPATKYFFQKLSIEERQASLFSATVAVLPPFDLRPHHARPWMYAINERFSRGKTAETLCYLLSLLQHEPLLLEAFFQNYTYCILLCFLEWPWQDFLFDIADRMWHFLSPAQYISLLGNIENGFNRMEYHFPKIFRELFTRCPVNFLKDFDDTSRLMILVSMLSDPKTIKVIFENVDVEGRIKMVSAEVFFEIFFGRFHLESESAVKMWLREARLSEEDRKAVKKAFVEYLDRAPEGKFQNKDLLLDEFSQLLDQNNPQKRCIDEETVQTKKLCL